jgi:hypothetical protein
VKQRLARHSAGQYTGGTSRDHPVRHHDVRHRCRRGHGSEGIAAGDTFFIYDPCCDLDDKQRFPFATIVTKDYGEFDNLSHLDKPGVYRLNVGVSRETFRKPWRSRWRSTKYSSILAGEKKCSHRDGADPMVRMPCRARRGARAKKPEPARQRWSSTTISRLPVRTYSLSSYCA